MELVTARRRQLGVNFPVTAANTPRDQPPEERGLLAHIRRPGEPSRPTSQPAQPPPRASHQGADPANQPTPKAAADHQFALLYQELKARAQILLSDERPNHTLQATALVNEAYLKLAQQDRAAMQNQSHALALAAIAMRRILVDHARSKSRDKRGGKLNHAAPQTDLLLTLADDHHPAPDPIELLTLERALQSLEATHPRLARLIELRFYGGLTNQQTATVLEVSLGTVENEWRAARALLAQAMA